MAQPTITKGFIKNWKGDTLLPITRGELVLDLYGIIALNSEEFLAGGKDGKGTLPGLITAAERAMLRGGSENGNSLADLYTKVGYINNGLRINNQPIKFYSDANNTTTPTPINLIGAEDLITITKATNSNDVTFGLANLTETDFTASNILKSITVDKYGRVTNVSGSALTSDELPPKITGKTFENGKFSGGTTVLKDIADDELAIVNKAYVDAKFDTALGTALGALHFAGGLEDAITAESALKNTNYYYKVIKDFELSSNLLDSETAHVNPYTHIKTGDTLIVYKTSSGNKFVHIPAGNDITTITVKEDNASLYALLLVLGNVTLQFSSVFDLSGSLGNTAYVLLPEASDKLDGYLSKDNFIKFSNYANNLQVSYTQTVQNNNPGSYLIGSIKIGTNAEQVIYGINNESSLTLEANATTPALNPFLKFTETGKSNPVNIYLKGLKGIKVSKNVGDVEFTAANEVTPLTTPEGKTVEYLTIKDGYQFGVKIGSIGANGINDGLVDFSEFVIRLSEHSKFETIDYSLKGANSTSEYRYGNTVLASAVAVTI